MFKVHSNVRQNDSECRKWKVYRGFTLHGFLPNGRDETVFYIIKLSCVTNINIIFYFIKLKKY